MLKAFVWKSFKCKKYLIIFLQYYWNKFENYYINCKSLWWNVSLTSFMLSKWVEFFWFPKELLKAEWMLTDTEDSAYILFITFGLHPDVCSKPERVLLLMMFEWRTVLTSKRIQPGPHLYTSNFYSNTEIKCLLNLFWC